MGLNNYTVFLLNDGTVKTVGENNFGQCGTSNTSTPQKTLYTIPNLNNVKQISCGNSHTVFLLNDGTVKTVGQNYDGQCGTGNNTSPQLSLYTIPNLTNVKQISCGAAYTVFLLNDGTVKTVGNNSNGQCGTGNTTSPQLSLYTIPNLNNVKQVSCGYYHTVFLLNDGTVKTVGNNNFGQCGTSNTTTPQLSLYTIPNLNNVKQISCGNNYTVFLLNDGTVKTVGYNGQGQCGTGSAGGNQLSLYTIPNLNNVKQISCGRYHTVFLLEDGTVKTVGQNDYGQCGTGNTTSPQLSLYTIPNLSNVKQVSCGQYHTVFLLNDGTVKTVGLNDYAQCGTGSAITTSPYAQLALYTIPSLTNNTKSLSDILQLQIIKYLLKQYNNYYSIKPEYYNLGNNVYTPLALSGGSMPNKDDINSFGFDNINDLNKNTTINDQTFKPIDKLYDKFDIMMYKSK